MSLFKEARRFVINQRINELTQANKHWPNSKNFDDREEQIKALEREMKLIDEEE